MTVKIGISTYYVKTEEINNPQLRGLPGQNLVVSTMDYSTAVREAGGLPLPIPLIDNSDYISEVVKESDGFIIAGGTDVNPMHYDTPVYQGLKSVNIERDQFELKLIDAIVKQKKPILGICRGLHLLNVYFGGTLYQDINSSGLTNQEHFCKMMPKYSPAHTVEISKKSMLYELLNKDSLSVNSYHHQAVNKLGENLEVMGKAKDGIIESFEHRVYPFLLAVQWHPEMMAQHYIEQLKIFELLVKASN